jgi:ELWxxDGT repeat protein
MQRLESASRRTSDSKFQARLTRIARRRFHPLRAEPLEDRRLLSISPPSTPLLAAWSDTGISNSDHITKATQLEFTGTGVAAATVRLYSDGVQVGSAVVQPGGQWNVVTSTLAPGAHAITATQTDTSETSDPTASFNVVVDTTAQSVELVEPTPNPTTVAPTSLVVAFDQPAYGMFAWKLSLTRDGSPVSIPGAATFTTSDNQTYTLGNLGSTLATPGNYQMTILADASITDAAGNVLATGDTTSFQVLAVPPPTMPDLTNTSDTGISSTDNVTNLTTPTFSGTATPGYTVNIFRNNTVLIGTGVADPSGIYSITVSTLTAGNHLIRASATDTAGGVSVATTNQLITVDTTAPTISSTTIAAQASPLAQVTLTFSDAVYGLSLSSLTLARNGGANLLTGSEILTDSGDHKTFTLAGLTALDSTAGRYVLTYTASGSGVTDAAGNPVTTSATVTWDYAPRPSTPDLDATSDLGVSNTDNLTADATPTFIGTATPGTFVYIYSNNVLVGTGAVAPDGTYSVTTSALGNGSWVIAARGADEFGHIGAQTLTLSIQVDTLAPTATISAITPALSNSFHPSSLTVSFSEVIVAGNIASLSLTRDGSGNLLSGSNTYTPTSGGTGTSWQVSGISSLVAPAGHYTFSFNAGLSGVTDRAGNPVVGSPSRSFTFVGAPTVPALLAGQDDGISSTDGITSIGAPTVVGTALPNGTVKIFSDGVLVGTGTASPSGSYSIALSTLTPGEHALTATVTEGAVTSTSSGGSRILVEPYVPVPVVEPILGFAGDPIDEVDIVFPWPVFGVTAAALSLTRDGGSNLLTGSESLTTLDTVRWRLTGLSSLTATPGTYSASLHTSSGTITDAAGHTVFGDAATTFNTPSTQPTGLQLLGDLNAAGASNPAQLTRSGSYVYFTADDGVHGTELWRTDGTPAGTIRLSDINLGGDSAISHLVDNAGTLIFVADNGSGPALWKSNGTPGGTSLVAALPSDAAAFRKVGNVLTFTSPHPGGSSSTFDYWQANATAISPIVKSNGQAISTNGGVAYVYGTLFIGDFLIYRFDGTGPATTMPTQGWDTVISSGDGGAGYFEYQEIVDTVIIRSPMQGGNYTIHTDYTYATDGVSRYVVEAWVQDPVSGNSHWVADPPHPARALPFTLGSVNVFAYPDAARGIELGIGNGYATGSSVLKDIVPGTGSSNPTNLQVVGSSLYFTIDGNQLWRTDGTSGGTALVGRLPSVPSGGITVLESGGNVRVFYEADFNGLGEELYAYTIGPSAPPTTTGVPTVEAEQDTTETVDLAGYFADADQSAASLSYAVVGATNTALVAGLSLDGSKLTLSFAPGGTGSATVTVRATDARGLYVETTFDVNVAPAVTLPTVQLLPNAGNPSLTDLVWTGLAGDDSVSFEDLGGGDILVTTTLAGGIAVNVVETFHGITGIVRASGLGGNDTLDSSLLDDISATLDGGVGNNTLYGGGANDVLIGGGNVAPKHNGPEGQQGSNIIVGGAGDDTIYGNAVNGAEGRGGNNILVGGSGNDTIYGNWTDGGEGGGRNIIVGGADADTLYDYKIADGAEGKGSILIADETSLDVPELSQVMLEWASPHTYNDRVNNILGPGSIGRLNGSAYLQPGSNVTSDAAVDQLWGTTTGAAFNWFLYTATATVDEINRAKAGETQTTL